MRKLFLLFPATLLSATLVAQEYSFRLKNALGFSRQAETVEVSVPTGIDLSHVQLQDEANTVIPFEAVGDTAIRFQAHIDKASTRGYTLSQGVPTTPQKLTYAAIKQPASRSDIAWENDITAYRMYSSVLLQNEPNTGNGVDLWVKKTSANIIDAMYGLSNYHAESQYGVDAYSVNGKRLGVGGVSHVVNGKLVVHAPHDACTITHNTALKSAFTLTYNAIEVDGVTYKKTLLVETTAGALLNKATVRYEPLSPGTAKTIRLAAAIYQHTDMSSVTTDGVAYTANPGVAGWAENKSEGTVTTANARFYQGIIMPDEHATTEVIDHHLCLTVDYTPGTELVYYFGGGWSVFPEGTYSCDDDWFAALDRFKQQLNTPLTKTSWQGEIPEKEEVINILHLANSHWQETHPTHGDHFWNRAVYHTGNMAAYAVTQDQSYLDYSRAWAERNNYWGVTGTDKSKWKYTYGESADYVLFGDNQICFQVYADLYNIYHDERMIERAREVMEYEMSTDYSGYWWWVDGFYMVMPVMTKLYNITGNERYLEKLHEYWKWGYNIMWDEEAGLYYRDGDYVYPQHKTSSGGKDFWARGDGWITAALPRVLEELPKDNKYRDEYIANFRSLAEALRQCQCTDAAGNGYWCRSLLEESYAPGYETSGTALITYGLLWGINNGILDEELYGAVVERAWRYLTTIALQPDGTVGYVQPIGSNAAPGTYMTASQTADFGVGAFLLAAAEMSKYASGETAATPLRLSGVELSEGITLALRFNTQLHEEGITDADNYLIDGQPLSADDVADIVYDGDRTITLTLANELDYGRYLISLRNLSSADGGTIDVTQSRTLLRTVPLSRNTTIQSVLAEGAQSGNPASNTIDNSYGTRWSYEGTGKWIRFYLGSIAQQVKAIDLAWYLGNTRCNYFDVQYSLTGSSWTTILANQKSSGMTTELERYKFPKTVKAKYIRVVCNKVDGTTWNSMTEARVILDEDDEDAIDATEDDFSTPAEIAIYDLNGRKVTRPARHGIYIQNGKKVVY